MKNFYLLLMFICPVLGFTQSVGINTIPNSSAALDISSNNKGLLIPRLTTYQRTNTIASPAAGLLVYDTNTKGFWYYDGAQWVSLASVNDNTINKVKSMYIPGSSLNYTPSASITQGYYGLNLSNSAGQVTFVIPKPIDWDSTKSFTITLHFSLPSNPTNTFIKWRLTAGGMKPNSNTSTANNGWDSYDYYTTEDASIMAAYAATLGYSDLSKTQSWTAKFSATYQTWYFGTSGVTVANSFSDNDVWRFGFIRGASVGNGETYSGNITVNAATVIYTAK